MSNNSTIERAVLLIQTHRYADAEKMLRQHLSLEPEDALALSLLSICLLSQEKKIDALTASQQAASLSPDSPFALTTHARSLWYNNRINEARDALDAAMQLAPNDSEAYGLRAQIEYQQRDWQLALNYAEYGLQFDPEDETLLNMRTMALVKLNRTAEATETVDYALYNNPQDAYSHISKAYVLIEQGRYEDASKSFRQALQLDPNNEHAREGLKEALRAKYWLYRGVLRFFLYMNKLTMGYQWAIILGVYFGVRILNDIAKKYTWVEPFIMPLVTFYLIFALATWIAKPLSNLILHLHPIGKHALTDDDKTYSFWAGVFAFSGIAAMVSSYIYTEPKALSSNLGTLGMTLFAMLVLIGGASSSEAGSKQRNWLNLFALLMFVVGPGLVMIHTFIGPTPYTQGAMAFFSVSILFYSVIVSFIRSWTANRM